LIGADIRSSRDSQYDYKLLVSHESNARRTALNPVSMSIGLGMAGTVEIYAAPHGPLLKGYRSAFYFASALAAIAVIVVGLFVRMPKMAHYRE
jgi:hypothetical protein